MAFVNAIAFVAIAYEVIAQFRFHAKVFVCK